MGAPAGATQRRRRAGVAVLSTAPWTRAPVRLANALGLFAGVVVAALLMTTVVSARPLLPAALGTAALRDDLAACPPASGLVVTRAFDVGQQAATADAVARAAAGLDGLEPPLATIQFGDVDLAHAGATSAAQLVSRADVASHLRLEAPPVGDGVLLGRRAATALGARAGDEIEVTGQGPTGPVALPVRVRAVFVDPREDADGWWCTLRSAIVGPLTGGALPFLFTDDATATRLATALGRGSARGTWEVSPRAPAWTLARARHVVPPLRARARALAAAFAQSVTAGTAAADGQDSLGHAERAAVTANATVGPVALGAFGLALLLLADAARTWVERRRQQLVVLKLRGVADRYLALKGVLEMLPAVLLGASGGIVAASALVRLAGPTRHLPAPPLTDALPQAGLVVVAVAVVLAGVVLVGARRVSAVTSGGARRTRVLDGVGEVVLLVLAGAAYYELRTRRSAIVGTGNAVHLDSLVLLFPVLLVAGAAGLLTRVVLRPALLRPSHRLGVAVWLAARRLAALRRRAVLVVSASAVAVGIVGFSSSLSASLRATARAKATLGLGADAVVPLDVGTPDATSLPPRSTVVLRATEATVVVKGHDPVDVLGVDPRTFASAAYWEPSFARASLPALLRGLGGPAPDGRVPVVAAGPGVPDELTIELRSATSSDRRVLDVRVVARARYFPGLNYGSTRSLVAVDAEVLRQRGIEAAVQVWHAGTAGTELLDAVRARGAEASVVRRATRFVDAAIVPQSRALDFLEVLGAATGAMAACALALHVTALGRRRVVSDALARQMGVRRRTALTAGLIEVASMVGLGWLIGVGLSWQALRMIHPYVDVSPLLLPPPLLRIDVVAPLLAGAALAVLAVVTTAVLDRRARSADDDEVLRHAG